uniref:Alpha-1-antitrypsin homolog n=1 Tax=Gouania willdenowi TaxID=441366 RepID=A0A8C5I451_GOUWI
SMAKMYGVYQSWALVAVMVSVVWADHHQHEENKPSYKILSSPNADFAFALYKSLNTRTPAGKNIFYSPLGISTALSMVSTGARGDTQQQVFSSLGYSALNQTQVNEAYGNLFMHGYSRDNLKLDVGNALAVRSGFSPMEKFLTDIRSYYSGEIFNVNMDRRAEAVAEINAHIANKTRNKIKDMVKDLDTNMTMVLMNYVYFKGLWQKPFNQDDTRKANFHVNTTTKVTIDMMKRTGHYKAYWDNGNHTTVIMLPYKGNSTMMVVLPKEGKMKEVENLISRDSIRHWRKSVSTRYVELIMPKFFVSADASLKEILKEMGMTKAFENTADFSGISNKVKIKLSKVSHRATLSVTEKGTEAAASTVVEFTLHSLPPTVRVNRPFLVFILESVTDSILFMGKINNPADV